MADLRWMYDGHNVSTNDALLSSAALRGFVSFCNPQEHGQATINLHQCIRANVSKGRPYLVALDRHGFVYHYL
jgi:hypothetical protein